MLAQVCTRSTKCQQASVTNTIASGTKLSTHRAGMYQLSAFYLARLFSDLPLDLAIPIIFLCIVYW